MVAVVNTDPIVHESFEGCQSQIVCVCISLELKLYACSLTDQWEIQLLAYGLFLLLSINIDLLESVLQILDFLIC